MVTVYTKSIVASKLRKLGKIKGHIWTQNTKTRVPCFPAPSGGIFHWLLGSKKLKNWKVEKLSLLKNSCNF